MIPHAPTWLILLLMQPFLSGVHGEANPEANPEAKSEAKSEAKPEAMIVRDVRNLVTLPPDGPAQEVILEDFYCHEGSNSPTTVTKDFLLRLGRLLEVGVETKKGLLRQEIESRGDELSNLIEDAEEVIKKGKKDTLEFWKKTIGAKFGLTRLILVNPPMGETRTVTLHPCYKAEDLKLLMKAQVEAAKKFLEAVTLETKQLEDEREAQKALKAMKGGAP